MMYEIGLYLTQAYSIRDFTYSPIPHPRPHVHMPSVRNRCFGISFFFDVNEIRLTSSYIIKLVVCAKIFIALDQ
jgi:hypothetical protein